MLFISVLTMAQVTPKALKADIKTPTATCTECKTIIESFVSKSIDGLVKISVRTTSGITSVSYYPDRTNIEEIKYAISNAGFDADNVLANPDTYANIPDCCKKPQDRKAPPAPKKQ
jgi:copper chaperone CopZ